MPATDLHALATFTSSIGVIVNQPCPITFTEHGRFLEVRAAAGAAGERHGLGMFVGNRLVISWGPKDKVEIGAYTRTGDTMEGLWVPPAARGDDLKICGREKSKRVAGDTYEITEAIAIDNSAYTGKVSIESMNAGDTSFPRPVRMKWQLHDGDYTSFAIAYADAMLAIFSFEPKEWHAISVYEPQADGSYAGVILEKDSTTLASEVISK